MLGNSLSESLVGWILYVPYLLTCSNESLGWPITASEDGVLLCFIMSPHNDYLKFKVETLTGVSTFDNQYIKCSLKQEQLFAVLVIDFNHFIPIFFHRSNELKLAATTHEIVLRVMCFEINISVEIVGKETHTAF